MADNITVSDANDVDRILATTEDPGTLVHTPKHEVVSSALPTNAATSALQSAGNTSLTTLAGAVSGSEFRVNIIDEGSVANTTNQATANGHLSTIAGDTTSLDSKITACNTGAVVLAAGTAEIGKLAAGTASIGTVVLGAGSAEIGTLGASTNNIGDVDVASVAMPSTVLAGKHAPSPAAATQLAASGSLTSGVTVKALAANTSTVFVGPSGVTTTTGLELSAKESVFVEVDSLSKVYFIASVAGEGITYLGT